MKLSDNYTEEDIRTLNSLGFITSMLMFALAVIAKVVGIL